MYWKYLKYVVKHKWFVFQEACKLGIPIRGLLHDLSKFRPSEFITYARYFYGNYPKWDIAKHMSPTYPYRLSKEGVAESFDLAWLKHIHRNPHHWQYWVLSEDEGTVNVLSMPDKYLKEMIADWRSIEKSIPDSLPLKEWYCKFEKSRLFEHLTKRKVDEYVNDSGRDNK